MSKSAIASLPVMFAVLLGTTVPILLDCAFDINVAAARVGVTSATDGDPMGNPPGDPERVLRIGIDIQANELITTGASDRAHLLFLDGTSLTVGPTARITIDKYVYDPNTKTGELAVSAFKGVLRVVGGKISKSNEITIGTPAATIGIRGGIAIVEVQATQTISTFVFGSGMTVSAAGQTQIVTRPGSQVTANVGGAPSSPTLIEPGALSGQLSQLEGGEKTGGQGSGNADQRAQSTGFSNANSGQGPSGGLATASTPLPTNQNNTTTNALSNTNRAQPTIQPKQTIDNPTLVIVTQGRFLRDVPYTNFVNNTLTVTPNPQNNALLAPTGTLVNGNATITLSDGRSLTVPWQPGRDPYAVSLTSPIFGSLNGKGFVNPAGDFFEFVFVDQNNKEVRVVGGTPTTPAQFPATGFAAHILQDAGLSSDRLPFAGDAVGDATLKAAANRSLLFSVYSQKAQNVGVVGGPAPNNERAVSMQATISIAGLGAAQKSYMGVFTANYARDDSNSIFNSGNFQAMYRLGADQKIGRLTSAESTSTSAGNTIYGPNANTMVYTPDSVSTVFTSSNGIVTSSATTRTTQASLNQPYTNLAGQDYYAVNVATLTTTPSTLGQTRTTRNMNGYVGGVVEQRHVDGSFSTRTVGIDNARPGDLAISTDASTNRASAAILVRNWDGASTSATFRLGGLTGAHFATSTFVDDKTYAIRDRPPPGFIGTTSVRVNGATSTGTDVNSSTALISYNTAPTAGFFQSTGVTPCTCEFMTWGWWGGDVRYDNASVYNANGRDRLNFATYVAGTLAAVVSLPNTGSATYSGHAVGNVVNGANSYVAAGTYTNTWNFASRTGQVSIGNFDGTTYTGRTALTAGTVNFTGPLSGANRTGTLNGSFFSSLTDPVKGQGGNFSISGTGYRAGGTFAAQKP